MFRFSLLSLLIFVAICCSLLALWARPQEVIVETRLQFDAKPPAVFGRVPAFDAREYELYRGSRLELIGNEYVLISAIRDPRIGSLPILRQNADPVDWLQNNLEVDDAENTEIVAIRLCGNARYEDQLAKVLNAVASELVREIAVVDRRKERELLDNTIRQANELRQRIAHLSSAASRVQQSKPQFAGLGSELDYEKIRVLRKQWHQLLRTIEELKASIKKNDRVRIVQPAMVT